VVECATGHLRRRPAGRRAVVEFIGESRRMDAVSPGFAIRETGFQRRASIRRIPINFLEIRAMESPPDFQARPLVNYVSL
jgi:hypothetical protein